MYFKKRKLFIGHLNKNIVEGSDGVVLKNRCFLSYIATKVELDYLDLDVLIEKRISYITASGLKLLQQIFYGGGIIVGSGGSDNSCKLIRLLSLLTFGKPIWVLGLGGNMHDYILASPQNISIMSKAKAIMAEGKKMVLILKKAGLSQAYYVPNFKNIDFIPKKMYRNDGVVKFVFFARVNKAKGCNDIFKAAEILNNRGLGTKFEVHFFGYKAADYIQEFDLNLSKSADNIYYEGARDARLNETYSELAAYDVMLFPTYWNDEGFPATVVDAFIAGLPVIATEWKCNGELIENGKNGYLIPIQSPASLADKMEFFIENQNIIAQMAMRMQEVAKEFDIKQVLSDTFLHEIGII